MCKKCVLFLAMFLICCVQANGQGFGGDDPNAVEPNEPAPVTITVEAGGDIAAANVLAKAGDTIEIAAGKYYLTSQIEIKDGVTYKGAGAGETIIDGNDTTRAFVAWGDRSFNNGTGNPNDSGPKDWVLDGLTIQNCVADTNDRYSYTGSAFDMMYNTSTFDPVDPNFAENDVDGSGGLNPEEANADNGGIRLPGPDGTEGTADDDLHRFDHIDTDGNGELSEAELLAQIAVLEDEFGDQSGDGGAINIGNYAVGTIQNCEFISNHTPAEGAGDDGGAIIVSGLSVVTINDTDFDGNYACSEGSFQVVEPAGIDGDGGHLKVEGRTPEGGFAAVGTTVICNRCTFINGNAEDDGGAIQVFGRGPVLRLDACDFYGNNAFDNGTVIFIGQRHTHEVTVTNCIFANNMQHTTISSDRMIEVWRNSKFVNCTFVGNFVSDQDIIYNSANAADGDNDGVNDEYQDATQIVNCIFANNTFGGDANNDHVLSSRNDSFRIQTTNCLFFNNTKFDGSEMPITNRLQNGSVLADPLLDEYLMPGPGSPAIDAGVDPATVVGIELLTDFSGNARPLGAGYDIGADEQ